MNFEDLGLSPETMKAIEEKGYTSPTPIQAKAIPVIQMTRDVVGLAQTGTGKTASFTLPMIDALSGGRAKARMPRSLVLAPTRELAAQVADNFSTYGKYHNLSKALLVGGEAMGKQMDALEKGVDVLIATPGRLLDLFDRGSILLNDIKILVIDEADRMLDMGFIPDIEKIVSLIPPTRQTLLFSATMPNEIKNLTEKFLSNPKEISVAAAASPAKTVEQFIVDVDSRRKNPALLQLLREEDVKNAFIFLNRKKDIDSVRDFLKGKGYKAGALHGDMPQIKRTETLQDFKDDKITLLVCSDVAARGIDIKGVSHVFNYDVPMNADDYVHRIGRTGRAGEKGRSWTLLTKYDDKFIDAIRKLTKNPMEPVPLPGGSSEKVEKLPQKTAKHQQEKPRKSEKKPHKGKHQEKKHSKDEDIDEPSGFGDDIPAFLR